MLLVIIQLAPMFVKTVKHVYYSFTEPQMRVGVVTIKESLFDSTAYVRQCKNFFEDKEIKALLLRIDCIGGSAGAAQALFNEIKELKKIHLKPVVVWIQNICTSGGYYVACIGDHLITTPSACIGSIGVYIQQPKFKQFIEQFKASYSVISAGEYKTINNPLLDTTTAQKNLLQDMVDDTYEQFIQDVTESRPQLKINAATTWANGKLFTGRQALALGLVDELGSQITVERAIKQKAPFEGDIEWVFPHKKTGLLQLFTGPKDDDEDTNNSEHSYISSAITSMCNYVYTKALTLTT